MQNRFGICLALARLVVNPCSMTVSRTCFRMSFTQMTNKKCTQHLCTPMDNAIMLSMNTFGKRQHGQCVWTSVNGHAQQQKANGQQ